jgi:hypothetical protein
LFGRLTIHPPPSEKNIPPSISLTTTTGTTAATKQGQA